MGQAVDTRNTAIAPGTHTLLQEDLDQRQKQQRVGPALCKRTPSSPATPSLPIPPQETRSQSP